MPSLYLVIAFLMMISGLGCDADLESNSSNERCSSESDSLCRIEYESRLSVLINKGVDILQYDSILVGCALYGSKGENVFAVKEIVETWSGVRSVLCRKVQVDALPDSIYCVSWKQWQQNSWEEHCANLYLRNYLVYHFNLDSRISNVAGTLHVGETVHRGE